MTSGKCLQTAIKNDHQINFEAPFGPSATFHPPNYVSILRLTYMLLPFTTHSWWLGSAEHLPASVLFW